MKHDSEKLGALVGLAYTSRSSVLIRFEGHPLNFSPCKLEPGFLFTHINLHGGSVKPFFGSSVVRAYRPFPRTGKPGETPDTRAAWNLQTRLKSAPESVTRCKQWLTSGSTKQAIRRRFSTCDVLARKGLRGSLKQVLPVEVNLNLIYVCSIQSK
jgi:hypothetical protein